MTWTGWRISFLWLIAGAALTSCATRPVAPPTVAQVDLKRYQGLWHEAARLPLVFQNGCTDSTAEYRLRPDGRVTVVNRCRRGNVCAEVRGTATVVDAATNARLEVRFDTWFGPFIPRSPEGNYWILEVAPDYSVALVGTPDRRNLWILARRLPVPAKVFDRLVRRGRQLGFPVGSLIVDARQKAARD